MGIVNFGRRDAPGYDGENYGDAVDDLCAQAAQRGESPARTALGAVGEILIAAGTEHLLEGAFLSLAMNQSAGPTLERAKAELRVGIALIRASEGTKS